MSDLKYFCTCDDWLSIKDHEVFVNDPTYGWTLQWIELTKEGETSSLVNKYGVQINYCPMCGKKLLDYLE